MPSLPIVIFAPIFFVIDIVYTLLPAIDSGADISELIRVMIEYFIDLF